MLEIILAKFEVILASETPSFIPILVQMYFFLTFKRCSSRDQKRRLRKMVEMVWRQRHRVYVEAAVADAAAKRKRARRAVGGGSGGSAGREQRKQGSKEAKRRW